MNDDKIVRKAATNMGSVLFSDSPDNSRVNAAPLKGRESKTKL